MRVSNNSKSFCSFSAVNTKYLKEAKKDYKLLWYVSPSILDSIEVDHFMRRMSDKDVIDTLEAIRSILPKPLKIELQDCAQSLMLELIFKY